MIDRYVQPTMHWLKRVVTQPRSELDRWQRAARFAYDLTRFGARQMQHDRAPQMAAALAFRVLFGLLPVLIVATILVREFTDLDRFLTLIESFLEAVGLDKLTVTVAEADTEPETLQFWLEGMIRTADGINLRAIGSVGFAIIIYASISLMVTIENSFNIIYRASEGRSWARRIPLYWFIMTISPVALGVAAVVDNKFGTLIIEQVNDWQWLFITVSFLWRFLIEWLVMFAVYTLVPHAKVAAKPAAIGAAVTVLLMEIGKQTMGAYLGNAFTISHLYGSLGLVPLFMFWVYLMWLGVLFGLQVSVALQMLHGRRLNEIEQKRETASLIDPAAVLSVMELIASRFNEGQSTPTETIASDASLPRNIVRQILDRLVEAGLLHRVDRDDDAVALALPPEKISADRLIDIGFALADGNGDGHQCSLLTKLRSAQRNLAAQLTLATLVPTKPSEP